jgi:hypothetical protein
MGSPEGRARYIAAMQAALEVQKTNLLLSTAPIVVISTQVGWVQSSQSNLLKAIITVAVIMLLLAALISLFFVFSGQDYIAMISLESEGSSSDSSPYLNFIFDHYKIIGGLSEENLVWLGRKLHGPLVILLCSGWTLLVVSIFVAIWTQPAAPQVH